MGNRQTGPERRDYYNYNQGNQLTSDRKHQYAYDGNDNLITKTETVDEKMWKLGCVRQPPGMISSKVYYEFYIS